MTTLQAYLDKLKPNVVVRGPLFPKPVEVITTVPLGDSLKLIGTGPPTKATPRTSASVDPCFML